MSRVGAGRSTTAESGQIEANLRALFERDAFWSHGGRRLVFWYDPDGSFRELASSLTLPDAEILTLGDTPFATKYKLLVEQPETPFVLYFPSAEPENEANALLDLQLAGQVFSADRAAILFRDLGLLERSHEGYLREHLDFFNAKARTDALMALGVAPDATEMDLRLAMMCVTADLKTVDAHTLVRTLLAAGLEAQDNPVWVKLTKFFTPDEVWEVVTWSLSYRAEQPSLRGLFVALTLTHLDHDLRATLPSRFDRLVIAPAARAFAFVDRWLRHSEEVERYAELTREVTPDLGLEELVAELDPAVYAEVETFELVDKALVRALVERLTHDPPLADGLDTLVKGRKTKAWYGRYRDYYAALEAAARLVGLLQTLAPFEGSAPKLFTQYRDSLFACDQAYRAFVCASDRTLQVADVLSPLVTQIEGAYVQGFLEPLGQAWSDVLETQAEWRLQGILGQQDFFTLQVKPLLDKNDREKAFVVISDALRYEVADELRGDLIRGLRGEADLSAMVSVLPSITKLGMAALLPGRGLTLTDDERVLKAGANTQGRDARHALLQAYVQRELGDSAGVLMADDVLRMSREEGRSAVTPHRVIYIYHNVIDSVGDKAASERDVFSACETALTELQNLTRRLVNQLNATNVFITADHGFLYQRQRLADADKEPLPPDRGLERSRRYVVGRELRAPRGTLGFRLPFLTGTSGEALEAVVPRGTLRFSISGAGSQYVHGGASLQEVVVPLIHYKHVRASKGDSGPSQKTNLQVTAASRRITNTRFSLTILQTLPVGERVRPREVSIGYYDAQGTPVTEERKVLLASTAEAASARQQTLRFSVSAANPDRTKTYYLVVRDTEDNLELIRENWTISLAITDDFGDF